MTEFCSYPRCKCIVTTSTSQPWPTCPRDLPDIFRLAEAISGSALEVSQRAVKIAAGVPVDRMTMAAKIQDLHRDTVALASALGMLAERRAESIAEYNGEVLRPGETITPKGKKL